jgi:hypothetical protein
MIFTLKMHGFDELEWQNIQEICNDNLMTNKEIGKIAIGINTLGGITNNLKLGLE